MSSWKPRIAAALLVRFFVKACQGDLFAEQHCPQGPPPLFKISPENGEEAIQSPTVPQA
jgi:hypothetical protein